MQKYFYLFFVLLSFALHTKSETVPHDHVLTNQELIALLDTSLYPELATIQINYHRGNEQMALNQLTAYFKERFSERYFFNWKDFQTRFIDYNQSYTAREGYHQKEAMAHLELYPATTQWKLPFVNLKGEEVGSYAYRHLSRQHKADDIAMLYHYTGNKKYLDYIPEQAKSLNQAFDKGLYEKMEDGNGAYEVYRAGTRMISWLMVHQILLASGEYKEDQQLEMIRTFLHTGAVLYHRNQSFYNGNHQTRGMSALAIISILFPEIQGVVRWQELSLRRLKEHLEKEIYADGFQFERSVHYHIADIQNFYLPYQMAQINGIELSEFWDSKIKSLFDVLIKIAMPDKNVPVLQDDTRSPWAEYNKIDGVMALGTILFRNPSYNYFAASKVPFNYYWVLRRDQLDLLNSVRKEKPEFGSCSLPHTGYYVMRQGWNRNDLYMIISSGLTKKKPDHQHGDMLGISAYAHGNVILPNYQVRYFLSDLKEFKNSWVKNVNLLDSIPHGREWKGNKGGSGFGKFRILPEPSVIGWSSNEEFDFFAGSHNGNKDKQAETYRSIIFVKDGFWIVKDHLRAKNRNHTSQQIWQGHYDEEIINTQIRSVFSNGAGLDIVQLNGPADRVKTASIRGKGRSVFEKKFFAEMSWLTLLHPFAEFEDRLDAESLDEVLVKGWRISSGGEVSDIFQSDALKVLWKNNCYFLFDATEMSAKGISFSTGKQNTDLFVKMQEGSVWVTNCGVSEIQISRGLKTHLVKPGNTVKLE